MSDIKSALAEIKSELDGTNARLVAVSKTKPISMLQEAYDAGQRHFGENKAQEMTEKFEALPDDIFWHMIGHLQRNKVKFIAPYVYLIHSVDSLRLLKEINKEAKKNDRVINCLLQVHIAEETTKFGFDKGELLSLINSKELDELKNVKIVGLMGMATYTDDTSKIRSEFQVLNSIFSELKTEQKHNLELSELSMGMSSDYAIALEEGSTLIRVGSNIFGERNYA
ncbi:MAG: YggS family pyridoxal phosphate-dependent enzyme [Cyclobacteriaceae bacterium]